MVRQHLARVVRITAAVVGLLALVGYLLIAGGAHAFLYTPGLGAWDLGTLGGT